MSHQSFSRIFRSGCALGMLLATALACYTPMQAAEAERRAVAQLEAALETMDYAPSEVVLLAEAHNSAGYTGVESEYVGAQVSRIYGINWTCEEIVADYEMAMLAAGWKQNRPSDQPKKDSE